MAKRIAVQDLSNTIVLDGTQVVNAHTIDLDSFSGISFFMLIRLAPGAYSGGTFICGDISSNNSGIMSRYRTDLAGDPIYLFYNDGNAAGSIFDLYRGPIEQLDTYSKYIVVGWRIDNSAETGQHWQRDASDGAHSWAARNGGFGTHQVNLFQQAVAGFGVKGSVAKAWFYGRYLTDTEIEDMALYYIDPEVQGTDDAIWVPDGSTTTLTDISGNGNNATMTGVTAGTDGPVKPRSVVSQARGNLTIERENLT